MSTVIVTKDQTGKLAGMGEKGAKAYAKFLAAVGAMGRGDTMQFDYKLPRSRKHHGLFFAQVSNLFDAQEQFADIDQLRKWLTVGAGYCDFVPGPNGRMVALPKSIAWAEMDESEFSELHAAVLQFLWTRHARTFLWPQLSEQQSWDGLQRIVGEGA